MKRFLFVVPPFAGHILPTISVARTLRSRGHQVAWAGIEETRNALPDDAELIPLEFDRSNPDSGWETSAERIRSRGWESLQVLWEDALVPLTRIMLPALQQAMDVYRPDVVISDQQALAGSLAARCAGLPWATFSTTSASVMDPLAELPKVKQWVDDQMRRLELEAGLTHIDAPDISPHLNVVFSTTALCGDDRAWPAHYRFVGPSIQDRPDSTAFPWEWLSRGPRVFVSLGTIGSDSPGNTRFLNAVAEGLRDFSGQVIMVAPPDTLQQSSDNLLVRERVPQLAVLREVDAVITHAGHNTVCETLANGLPMVVAPIRHDQPIVAGQVLRAGAGVRLRYGRTNASAARLAVEQVLSDVSYRAAAERIRDSFRAAGGSDAAADALEMLL